MIKRKYTIELFATDQNNNTDNETTKKLNADMGDQDDTIENAIRKYDDIIHELKKDEWKRGGKENFGGTVTVSIWNANNCNHMQTVWIKKGSKFLN